ncbi:hypothetical protein CcaCcLH18_07841 [Colletotrichum camelliae]|nr:hypothetical protein CcaCcLH18_07841 [Colletotrichum camelliae]
MGGKIDLIALAAALVMASDPSCNAANGTALGDLLQFVRERLLVIRLEPLPGAKEETNKLPIKFRDAVGRKFRFPFGEVLTWEGMEEMIRQMFIGIDGLRKEVQEGRYDLIGPNGEIILPQIWERAIQPDWAIEMPCIDLV